MGDRRGKFVVGGSQELGDRSKEFLVLGCKTGVRSQEREVRSWGGVRSWELGAMVVFLLDCNV